MATSDDPAPSVDDTEAPNDRERAVLDVRNLGPPGPLVETLETLAELPDDAVLVQRNDRAPQRLYPKLRDRGYTFETVNHGDEVVTVVWRPSQ